MNPQTHFRYPHFDHSKIPVDVRKHPASEVLWEHCYFVGFRISVNNRYDYQHSLVLADEYEALQYGVSSEIELILKRYKGLERSDVVPIYIRNLQLLDPEFLSADHQEEMRDQINDCLCKRDDMHFVVLGLFGESKVGILDMYTGDALNAIRLAIFKGGQIAGDGYTTLEVRNAHPVTTEFDALFLRTAERMKALADSESIGSEYVH